MQTILGAGGAIGTELLNELLRARRPVRLVARNPKPVAGAQTLSADLSSLDQAVRAVAGSSVVHLVVGLKYDSGVWRELWPRIMGNAIEACKRANAKLVFFDNVYMYGKVDGRMTEETPFNPCSRKGEVRARIATALLDEIRAGRLTALIARAADFYGPKVRTSVPNLLVLDKLAKGGTPAWLANDSVPHSYTYTPDAARSLVLLADSASAWNQTWHLPTAANPPTGGEFIRMAAKEFGVAPKYRVLLPWMIRLAGLFDADIRESHEMLYQSRYPYLFDSGRFTKAFRFEPTGYADGIRQSVAALR